MKDTISVHTLWSILSKDPIYSDAKLVEDIIDNLCRQKELSFKTIYEEAVFFERVYGDSNPVEFRLILCDCLDEAYQNDLDGNIRTYSKASKAAKMAETLLRFWILLGLKVEKYNQEIVVDPERHTFYDFVVFAGMDSIEKHNLKSFLQNDKLPLPTKLFADEKNDTHSIHQKLVNDHTDSLWVRNLYYKDLVKFYVDKKHEKDDKDKDICQFKLLGDHYSIIYSGKERLIDSSLIGMKLIHFLLSNPNKSFSLNDIHTEVYGSPVADHESISDLVDFDEVGMDIASLPDPKQVKKCQDKIKNVYKTSISRIKKNIPALESHLSRSIITKKEFRYAPESEINWIL